MRKDCLKYGSLAWIAVYMLLAGPSAGVAEAQSIQARATVSSDHVRAESVFQLTVTATQSGTGTSATLTIDWPKWESLGLTRTPGIGDGTSTSTFTSNGQTGVTHTVTVRLQASRPGIVIIPPIPVRGTTGVAITAPITVTVDPAAPAALTAPQPAPAEAAPPVPSPNTAPPLAPEMPPFAMPGGSLPGWQDPPFGGPPSPVAPQAPSGQDALANLQMKVGAAAFFVIVIVVVIVAVQKLAHASQQSARSAPPPATDDPAIQRLVYLTGLSDPRPFYAEAGFHLRVLLGRATGLDLTGQTSEQLAAVVHQRFGDQQLLQAVQSCAARCESVTAGTSGARLEDINRDLHLLRYLGQLRRAAVHRRA